MNLKKKILLGISAGVGFYKSFFLIRKLIKSDFEVKVVLSKNSLEFINPKSFEMLGVDVYYDTFSKPQEKLHINLSEWADIIVVYPATYDFIGKVYSGVADDLLTSIMAYSLLDKFVLICPAMHEQMWRNFILQRNVEYLKNNGIYFLGPVKGELLGGGEGMGRLVEVEDVVLKIKEILKTKKFLKGKKILIAFGKTYENIDKVRVITNLSSGKLGLALLRTANKLGADVKAIVSGMRINYDNIIYADTSETLLKVLKKEINWVDIFIMLTAVCDFKPKNFYEGKIKREREIAIKFEPVVDILASLPKKNNQIFIGFALEEQSKLFENALKKLKSKKLDYIVGNDLKVMGEDWIEGIFIDKKGKITKINKMSKNDFAFWLFRELKEREVFKNAK